MNKYVRNMKGFVIILMVVFVKVLLFDSVNKSLRNRTAYSYSVVLRRRSLRKLAGPHPYSGSASECCATRFFSWFLSSYLGKLQFTNFSPPLAKDLIRIHTESTELWTRLNGKCFPNNKYVVFFLFVFNRGDTKSTRCAPNVPFLFELSSYMLFQS